ncbi:hypothetical protein HK103_002941 [Boothiomyces macroporosus]|uniref:FAD/NAD(P)-binding domain-containing protein n=1 Tax=Boothiomyces macroporosus TaxID=261099 RepID=A0AAD5ULC5_9FUNG|nr:hypothetical protein HK103_002941 [Boothiomyces macroporosus]
MTKKINSWTVVGSGPAGITAIGVLLENKANDIYWIDPEFKVGDLSQYPKIPGNTIISLLNDRFFGACSSFEYDKFKKPFQVLEYDGDRYCYMQPVISTFQTITDQFKDIVETIKDTVVELQYQDGIWSIKTSGSTLYSKGVVLATGSVPSVPKLPYELDSSLREISLKDSLDADYLKQILDPKHSKVAVYGSSHSAILALEYLTFLGIETVNVYKSSSEILFAENRPEGYVNWFTGLKGAAAEWAKRNIVESLHPKLTRVCLDQSQDSLKTCTHYVYCCGFVQRPINVVGYEYPLKYDQKGLIGPNLYGVGIGFPPIEIDLLGKREEAIGFVLFLDHLRANLPKDISQ